MEVYKVFAYYLSKVVLCKTCKTMINFVIIYYFTIVTLESLDLISWTKLQNKDLTSWPQPTNPDTLTIITIRVWFVRFPEDPKRAPLRFRDRNPTTSDWHLIIPSKSNGNCFLSSKTEMKMGCRHSSKTESTDFGILDMLTGLGVN